VAGDAEGQSVPRRVSRGGGASGRGALAVVLLFALTAASVLMVWPCLAAIVWATMMVGATWPFMIKLERWLLGK
jgi:predicted PurR-regulated permease PerM